MRRLHKVIYVDISKEKCFRGKVINFCQHFVKIFVKVFSQVTRGVGGVYKCNQQENLLLNMSTSTQIHSISSVSRFVRRFHFKSLDKYIAALPPSPAIRFFLTNLNPGI